MNPFTTPTPAAGGFDDFHARLGTRDRLSVDRHLAACEKKPTPDHARLWRRLAGLLSELSPHSVRMSGQRAALFFVADGGYSRQSFAMEDMTSGSLSVYLPDVMDRAVAAGIVTGPVGKDGEVATYGVAGTNERLDVESLTARGTTSAPEYYRHMLGWNRRAVRITMPTNAESPLVQAVEAICRLSASEGLRDAAAAARPATSGA
jgi:hypothetical protein